MRTFNVISFRQPSMSVYLYRIDIIKDYYMNIYVIFVYVVAVIIRLTYRYTCETMWVH